MPINLQSRYIFKQSRKIKELYMKMEFVVLYHSWKTHYSKALTSRFCLKDALLSTPIASHPAFDVGVE